MELIDSHCHLDFSVLQDDIKSVLSRAKENQVNRFIVPSVRAANFSTVCELARVNSNIYIALGMHPCFMNEHEEPHLLLLEKQVRLYRPSAIGEIGLDFFICHDEQFRKQQLLLFVSQVALAKRHQLPVILHVRKAHDQVLNVLKKAQFSHGGIVHAFNGSDVQAKRYTQEFGFKLGFGGAMTHPKALKIRSLASTLPLSDIVLETDAPDMPLYQMAREFNEPANILDIAMVLSKLRSESLPEIADQILLNTKKCLSIA